MRGGKLKGAILVTGGAGFIGSNTVERLLELGEKVVCFDNFDNYYSPEVKRENIKPFLHNKNFSLIEADIRDKNSLGLAFKNNKIEKVLHLAARAGVRPSIENPGLYEEVNIRGTLNLLEASVAHGVKNFVFASSSSVYGRAGSSPFREDMECVPISPYGVTKLAGELYCRYFSSEHGMNCVCLRYFTAYGPRQRPEMAIHKFTRLIDGGKEVQIYGDGSSVRDYTYIGDIAEGTISALMLEGAGFEIINLGSSARVKLLELVPLIEAEIGKKAKVKRLPEQAGDMPLTYADISKAGRILGYAPKTKIKEGIAKFVSWYRDVHG